MSKERVEREVEKLRSDAHYAYLDGRTKRAKELNKKADELASSIGSHLSFNDVHKTLNKWCRQGHVSETHLVTIVREIVALPATPTK